MLCAEEPDELIAHVRICGGAGGQPPALPGNFGSPLIDPYHHEINKTARKENPWLFQQKELLDFVNLILMKKVEISAALRKPFNLSDYFSNGFGFCDMDIYLRIGKDVAGALSLEIPLG